MRHYRQNPAPERISPDQVLRRAERILKSEPGYMKEFLARFGIKIELQVSYWTGELDSDWSGSPEEWPAEAEDLGFGYVDDAYVTSYRLVITGPTLARGARGRRGPDIDPYAASMEALRERGWAKNPRMSPDRILSHAARILHGDPVLMDTFIDQVIRGNPKFTAEFLKRFGIDINLQIEYYSDEEQSWAGAPEDWPAHAREYDVTGDQIERFDLSLGKYLLSDWGPYPDPLEPMRDSLDYLYREGYRDPPEGWVDPLAPPPIRRRRRRR